MSREAALEALAGRYFRSRSPATLEDFKWWSGLPVAAARHALEMVEPELTSAFVDSRPYWTAGGRMRDSGDGNAVHVLPAFDEFLISYKDRSATLPAAHHEKVVSSNGIFRPVIVVGGTVSGLWRRSKVKDGLMIEARIFIKSGRAARMSIEKAFARYARFMGKPVHLAYKVE